MATEYYVGMNGQAFLTYGDKKEFLYVIEGNDVFKLFKGGEKLLSEGDKASSFSSYLRNGLVKKAPEEILNQFNASKVADGYYSNSKTKGFSVWQTIGDKKKRSIYLMLRNGGDWETVMISGPDFCNDFKKGSLEAAGFDEKVENGEWIKVEVIEK